MTNIIFPFPAKEIGYKFTPFGGWLSGLFNQIKKEGKITLGIASTYSGNDLKIFYNKGTTYYLLPCSNNTKYCSKLESYWRKVVEDFDPDLIHLHGTEYPHGLALMNVYPEKKYLVSIQGLIKPYAKAYLAGLTKEEIRNNPTIKTIIFGDELVSKKTFEKRAIYEKQILQNCTAITGRTEWDKKESISIAGKKPYFECNETLRASFYSEKWDVKNIQRHSIYISQASYPIKGLHSILPTLARLKKEFPDLTVFVAGSNPTSTKTWKEKLKISGYGKILKKKIEKYNLEKQIIFLGQIPEQSVAKKMKNSHIYLQCSSIENSPNSLGEAMLLGMPCIASNVGGTSSLLTDKQDGLLFNFGDTRVLEKYISKVFSDDEFAKKIGNNARRHAQKTHDPEKNANDMLAIYNKIISWNYKNDKD